jgi:hypothetical protein
MTHFRPPMHCRRSAPARLGDVRRGPHYSSEVTRCFREVLSTPVQPRIDAAMPAGALLCRGCWRLSTGCVRATVGRSDRMFAGAWCVHVGRSRSYEFDCVDLCGSEPFYLGNRHARRRGDAFIATYIETAHQLVPNTMLHFEDFGPEHARVILARYALDYCVFNDDVQGTGAVVMAAVYSGLKVAGTAMKDQTLVVFGSGTAGVGIADQLRDAMIADGVTQEQATSQVWLVDKQGLLFDDMDDLRDFQTPYAKNRGGRQMNGTRQPLRHEQSGARSRTDFAAVG